MMFDYYEYRLPVWCLPGLINGDVSGLSEEDEDALMTFEVGNEFVTHWEYDSEEEPFFCPYPDIGLATDCKTVRGYFPIESDPLYREITAAIKVK